MGRASSILPAMSTEILATQHKYQEKRQRGLRVVMSGTVRLPDTINPMVRGCCLLKLRTKKCKIVNCVREALKVEKSKLEKFNPYEKGGSLKKTKLLRLEKVLTEVWNFPIISFQSDSLSKYDELMCH